jgi:hypothetical protein
VGSSCDVDVGDVVIGPLDPGAVGPFTVARDEYNYGDTAANLPDFPEPVELRAEVTYPAELGCGPFPIVFMMHGINRTCLSQGGGAASGWPCAPVTDAPDQFCGPVPDDFCDPSDPILPNYKGYRYFADRLASHGIIAVSISANGINYADFFNVQDTLEARAELFERHFGLWLEFSTLGSPDFGNRFVDRVDLSRVGLMGHSRGGGGVARVVDTIKRGGAPDSTIGGNAPAVEIKAVLLVGAVEGDSDEDHRITDTALGVVLPYCDGDQDAFPSVGYFDASRYAVAGDRGPKHTFEVFGANHNKYNTVWDPDATAIEAVDDWTNSFGEDEGPFCQPGSPERLSSTEQQGTLIAIGSAFFRRYLRNERAFAPFLRGDASPPPSAMTDDIFVGYHPKDEPEDRLDVNRLTVAEETTVNTLGGSVSAGGLERFEFCDAVGGGPPNGCLTLAPPPISIGRSPHAFYPAPSNQLRIAWDGSGRLEKPAFINDLPAEYRDVSGYRALQFRAFVDFTDPLNPVGQPQDLRVVLRDGAGLAASVAVSDHARALFFPPPVEEIDDSLSAIPRGVFNTVRVPLSAFHGVFLTDIQRVELVFDRTPSGAINLADLMFADEAPNKTPRVSCEVAEPRLMIGGDKLVDVGLSVTIVDDDNLTTDSEVFVYSDEDDVDGDNKQSSPDAKNIAPGTLRLRAEYDKDEDGRVYVIVAKASDNAGALGYGCCTTTVPTNNNPEHLENLEAQATSARQQCTAFVAASEGLAGIPSGFFETGDGPVIGPNQ